MELSETIKNIMQQQELYGKLNHINAAMAKQAHLFKSLEIINKAASFANLLLYNPIVNDQLIPKYAHIFRTIEHLSTPAVKDYRNLLAHFNFATFDFLDHYKSEVEEPLIEEKKEVLYDETSRLKKIITDAYKNELLLLKITPREFEEVITELLFAQGCSAPLNNRT